MSEHDTLAFTAALLMAGGAFAQAPVNTTTTPPQPTATEQGQPRPASSTPLAPQVRPASRHRLQPPRHPRRPRVPRAPTAADQAHSLNVKAPPWRGFFMGAALWRAGGAKKVERTVSTWW